jgi:hypothetical protein
MKATIAMLVAALALASCGGSGEDGGSATAPPEPAAPASAADFPTAQGKTLSQLTAGLEAAAIVAPSSAGSQKPGSDNRFAFIVVDTANKQIEVAAVAVYTSRPDGSRLRGPFVARRESLDVAAPYRSAQTASDLANGKTFYVAEPSFESAGQHIVTGLVRRNGKLAVAESPGALVVGAKNGPPEVGDRAIRMDTLTGDDVAGKLEQISTRMPPPAEMLKTDLADALGKQPVVLLFATPALCASRTCGPVVDIAEQVRAQNGKGVTFIQQEIYQDNDPGKPVRPQVSKWRLPTEPWAFVIDRTGRVSARFEGVFSVGELARAVAQVQ